MLRISTMVFWRHQFHNDYEIGKSSIFVIFVQQNCTLSICNWVKYKWQVSRQLEVEWENVGREIPGWSGYLVRRRTPCWDLVHWLLICFLDVWSKKLLSAFSPPPFLIWKSHDDWRNRRKVVPKTNHQGWVLGTILLWFGSFQVMFKSMKCVLGHIIILLAEDIYVFGFLRLRDISHETTKNRREIWPTFDWRFIFSTLRVCILLQWFAFMIRSPTKRMTSLKVNIWRHTSMKLFRTLQPTRKSRKPRLTE